MNLLFSYMSAATAGEHRHAKSVMEELDIGYKRATPQSLGDCWQFWGCSNVPKVLPDYLQIFKGDDI